MITKFGKLCIQNANPFRSIKFWALCAGDHFIRAHSKRDLLYNKECLVRDTEGNLLKQAPESRNRWREYYHQWSNSPSIANQEAIESLPQYPVHSSLGEPPSLDEVDNAIKLLKNNKAPGLDELPAEIFKHGGREIRAKLHYLFCKIWKEEVVPTDFTEAAIVNIFKKKGDRADCTNYRGISLFSVAGKI